MRDYSKDEKVLAAFLRFYRPCDLVKATGLSKSTILRLRQDKAFMAAVQARKAEILTSVANKLRGYLERGADILQEIAEDTDAPYQCRINAVNSIQSGFTAISAAADIETRIQALESEINRSDTV